LFLFVLFFDFRRFHGLCKGQRQRVAVIGRGLAARLHVRLLSITTHCVGKNSCCLLGNASVLQRISD
jgi:hypothetical protein